MCDPGLILLAAGGSSRMGQAKQLLPWKSSTLLQEACQTALLTPCRPALVVLGCQAEACAQAIAGDDIIQVVNRNWRQGIGTSIALGIWALEKMEPQVAGALILLADQPSLGLSHLESLLHAWREEKAPLVATQYGGTGGVPAIFNRRYFKELRDLDADEGARRLIAREDQNVLLVESLTDLIDLDTFSVYKKRFREQFLPASETASRKTRS